MEKKEGEKTSHHGGAATELLWMAGVATSIKLLLVPAYRSTDFEVHRNWLAVTHSLPASRWYLDDTSPWTLDYPPFFAFFECFLAYFARLVDPHAVHLTMGLDYAPPHFVLFHRATVMCADALLYVGLWLWCRRLPVRERRFIYAAVAWSPGLFMVDHIHFQYNGFLLGILFVSLSCIRDGRDLVGGVVFAALLCFKHLFLFAAPVYFVYLLRHYCRGDRAVVRFLLLGGSVLGVLLLAFGPFFYYGQIDQLLSRLFPFGRGLLHAFWAPNVWSLYVASDKAISLILRKLGGSVSVSPAAAMTGGLVGDFSPHAVFPQITPMLTSVLVLLAMLPCLVKIWKHPLQGQFVKWVVYAFTCGFLFGWHVHEKACLHFVIPQSLIALRSSKDAGTYLLLSSVSYYSLFPLLFESKEYFVKLLLLLCHSMLIWIYLSTQVSYVEDQSVNESHSSIDVKPFILGKWKGAYLMGMIILEAYGQLLHPFLFNHLPFMPLLLTSLYCSLGIIYYWASQLFDLWSYGFKKPSFKAR